MDGGLLPNLVNEMSQKYILEHSIESRIYYELDQNEKWDICHSKISSNFRISLSIKRQSKNCEII